MIRDPTVDELREPSEPRQSLVGPKPSSLPDLCERSEDGLCALGAGPLSVKVLNRALTIFERNPKLLGDILTPRDANLAPSLNHEALHTA